MLSHNTCYSNFSQTLKFKIWIIISKATNTTHMYCIYLFIYFLFHSLTDSFTQYLFRVHSSRHVSDSRHILQESSLFNYWCNRILQYPIIYI